MTTADRSKPEPLAHPYIPNSSPQVRREMLHAIGVESIEVAYLDGTGRRTIRLGS